MSNHFERDAMTVEVFFGLLLLVAVIYVALSGCAIAPQTTKTSLSESVLAERGSESASVARTRPVRYTPLPTITRVAYTPYRTTLRITYGSPQRLRVGVEAGAITTGGVEEGSVIEIDYPTRQEAVVYALDPDAPIDSRLAPWRALTTDGGATWQMEITE